MKNLLPIILFTIITNFSFCQTDSTWSKKPEIILEEFLDVYYIYDFNKPSTSYRQTFLYNHNRHNEFNVNLALLKLKVVQQKYRANFGLQAGTYPEDNYKSEPAAYKYISEANIGISLSNKKELWLDAGIMNSYIGFEGAISTSNLTLTRSLLAENSPYFVSGAQLGFKPSKKWFYSALLLNGWQRIQRVNSNSLLSAGTQITYTPNENVKFNWSTFIGTDDPDSTRRMRYFSNLYSQINPTEKLKLIFGFDIGMQQKSLKSESYNYWFSPVIISQFKLSKKWFTAIRLEHYDDQKNVIISTANNEAFQTASISLNFDFIPTEAIQIRLEGRYLQSDKAIFSNGTNFSNHNFFIGTSIAFNILQKLSKNERD